MSANIPKTMRAAVLREPGKGLHVEEIQTPHPRAGEVLIKVSACGMCHSDLHVINGAIAFLMPALLGHEVAGEIVEVGPGNDKRNLKVGDKVAGAFLMPCGTCEACSKGRDDLCDPFFSMNRLNGTLYDGETRLADLDGNPIWMYSMGGLAEYAVSPATSVAKAGEGIDPVAGSILGCAALTAYGAVRRGANLQFGETCAVVATGGVGSNIISLARAFGARKVVAIDVSDEKLAPMKDLGATDVINSTKVDDIHQAVVDIVGGTGVDVSFEALGIPATWTTALDVLADGGRMVPIGLGAGVQTAGVEINRTVRRGQSILGNYGARTRQDLPEVVRLAEEGVIHYEDVVTRHFALEDANEGYELLKAGKINGRGVVDMSL